MEKHNINLFLGSVQIVMSNKEIKIFDKYNFANIDTVHGICENCQSSTILVAICSAFIDVLGVVLILYNILMEALDIYRCHKRIKNGSETRPPNKYLS